LATNIDSIGKSVSPKKRTLQYDDHEEQIENTPLSKRQSPLIGHRHEPIISSQPSVVDDEELDFM